MRSTADPVAAERLARDVGVVMDTIADGGVAIVPLDVAYAIVGATPAAIRRIYDAKQRSSRKPCGMFGSAELSRGIHRLTPERHEIVRYLADEARLPFSVVAPYDPGHPLLVRTPAGVMDHSTKEGTLDMLINAGQFHDEIARQSRVRELGVFGSSANLSLAGSRYRLDAIDAPVLAAADVCFDYGVSRYVNDHGLSSSIIDFVNFSVLRVGHRFEEIAAVFANQFGIALGTSPAAGAHA